MAILALFNNFWQLLKWAKVNLFLKQYLHDLCSTQKSGTFAKTFNLSSAYISGKVWGGGTYHFIASNKVCAKTVLKTNGLYLIFE